MVNRLVSVGDDFTLPAAVQAADANLPARLQDTALNATILDGVVAGQPSNAFPSRKLASKLDTRFASGTVQRARVVATLDSTALFKWHTLYGMLDRSFGGRGAAGAVIGSGTSGTGWSTPGVSNNGITGTVTAQTAAFDIWPSGLADLFATGATKAYGILGSTPTWDTVKVYYAGTGTFEIQIDNVAEPGFTNVSGGGNVMGIATITRGSSAARAVKIVNLTGTHRIIGVSFEDSTQAGVLFANISQGGIALDQQTAQGYANFQTFLTDFNPDLITFEAKENSSYYATALETFLDVIDAGAPTATFVGIGSTPIAVNDADQVVQNAQLRAACQAHGKIYWDGYEPIGSYAALDALDWEGDGTHVHEKASSFLASLMARDLGLFDHAGSDRPFNVNAKQIKFQQKLLLGQLGDVDVTGLDVVTTASGNFTVTGPNGIVMRIPAGGAVSNGLLPNTAQLGLNNCRWTADTNGISAKNPAGNADANVNGKQIVALSQGLRTLPVTTAGRPSGGTVGDGTHLYDSTLNAPIWWNAGAYRAGVLRPTSPVTAADTSGATLAALETEVNTLKGILRTAGLMA